MPFSPFSSTETFKQAFIAGLQRLLGHADLGGYILTLANASFDAEIYEQLKIPLKQRFEQLSERCKEALRNGRELPGAPDDQAVFLKLMALGFEGLQLNEFRQAGDWELQFNHIRAFRPARMAAAIPKGVHHPFNPAGFHFNKSFLRKEVFWLGELKGLEVELLFNKFPFVPLHGLLVPERCSREPQFLSHPYHLFIWALTEKLAEKIPGIGFAYNSFGAFASVNHLHFQMFVRDEPLPIGLDRWLHNGGEEAYPIECEVFTSPQEAWERLHELHSYERSYNLIYYPGVLYCLPRKTQGSYQHAPWTGGFAWHELAGGITTFNREDYTLLDDGAVCSELAKLRLPDDGFNSAEPFN